MICPSCKKHHCGCSTQVVINTDKELWREIEDDYYSPSIHVTEHGGIGINVGGCVAVKPVREWHKLAFPYGTPDLSNNFRPKWDGTERRKIVVTQPAPADDADWDTVKGAIDNWFADTVNDKTIAYAAFDRLRAAYNAAVTPVRSSVTERSHHA